MPCRRHPTPPPTHPPALHTMPAGVGGVWCFDISTYAGKQWGGSPRAGPRPQTHTESVRPTNGGGGKNSWDEGGKKEVRRRQSCRERQIRGPRWRGRSRTVCVLMCVCACAYSTGLVTSGVIFLASRRDSEIIRNVSTHWRLHRATNSLSLSFALALFYCS